MTFHSFRLNSKMRSGHTPWESTSWGGQKQWEVTQGPENVCKILFQCVKEKEGERLLARCSDFPLTNTLSHLM